MHIDIGAISLDLQNFRHKPVTSESEALRLMLEDERNHKVSAIAADIVEQGGLDPSSLLIVTERDGAEDQYIALEGNRRITAMKALATPDLTQGLPTHALFKKLSPKFLALKITSVDCVILDRAKASVWIKRKHYKGMGGKGVMPWNAVATARSDASEGQYTKWMTALAFLEEHNVNAEEIRDRIEAKTTSVERVLASSAMMSVLGLNMAKAGRVEAENSDEASAVTLLEMLMESMASINFKEPLVTSLELQKTYLEKFAAHSVRKLPLGSGGGTASGTATTGGATGGATGTQTQGSGSTGSATGSASGTNPGKGTTTRSRPVKDRKNLADRGLAISNGPLNQFYSELKSLSVETKPHISAAIIRVFVEKATTVYLEALKIPPLNKQPNATWHDYGIKLHSKVDAALTHLDPAGNNPDLRNARDIANGNRDKSHTLDHLNVAIHDHRALPAPSEIITIWDRYHPYFVALFAAIEAAKPKK